MRLSALFGLPFVLGMAACQPTDAPPPADAPPAAIVGPAVPVADTCGAAPFAPMIGASEAAISGLTLPVGTRVIHAGDAVTEDYSATRLNIAIGADGKVSQLTCA
jgi:hypothetical protein